MKTEFNQYVGDQIKKRRKLLGFNQTVLADYLGLSRAQITNIELGTNGTPHETLWRICNALHCTPNDLFPPTKYAEHSKKEVVKTKLVPISVIESIKTILVNS